MLPFSIAQTSNFLLLVDTNRPWRSFIAFLHTWGVIAIRRNTDLVRFDSELLGCLSLSFPFFFRCSQDIQPRSPDFSEGHLDEGNGIPNIYIAIRLFARLLFLSYVLELTSDTCE
ncbi:hypothetical protein AVEN_54501-1 [Araneus ventricosus]|uniref:Uncharacterized protein n=1 Tax=Araneus ventricosus TaxID=182803 RepID=A0A4Y2EK93_ARAVE|nr:hypothetical protein AVEN_54501-1 [Araneus ventricosus]